MYNGDLASYINDIPLNRTVLNKPTEEKIYPRKINA